jgi:hypothetical protein
MKRTEASRLILGTTVWLKPGGKKYVVATIDHGKVILRENTQTGKDHPVPWATSVYYREDGK